MNRWVEISFQCIPLRSVARLTPPVDASVQIATAFAKLRGAAAKHGFHNSYYLHDGRCVYHLTNHEQLGTLEFHFEGTVLTDAEDMKTMHDELHVELTCEICPWLVAPATNWFMESVREAVRVEFDRFITAGDRDKAVHRMEQLRTASDAQGGFLGLGI
jgi:hypothetical protein